jgi:signal transduction histidine kinase
MSHELRTPLNIIIEFSDDLKHHANQYGISLNIIDDLDEIEGLVFCK